MAGPRIVERKWIYPVQHDEAQIRCRLIRRGRHILDYTVQLELWREGNWYPIVRFDNAHGFCHRDTIHPDGSQDKVAIYRGDANTNFTEAVEYLRDNWPMERERYRSEISHD
jgi:hypothetical protein